MSSPSRAPASHPAYRTVLRQPYALRTFGAALLGRFSYGVVFVSLVVALTRATGSYAWAGTALALFGLSTSCLAPLRARLVDRHGPRRVLPALAGGYAAMLIALTVAAWGPGGAPRWTLAVLTVAAGGWAPPLGPVMRALWSVLMPDAALRQRAFSLDTVVEELLYVIGPVVAGAFISFGNPAWGIGVSALLILAGTLALVSSPGLRAWPGSAAGAGADAGADTDTDTDTDAGAGAGGDAGAGAAAGPRRHPARRPTRPARRPARRLTRALKPVLGPILDPVLVAGGIGICLGALSLLVVAAAERHHHLAAVAWIEAGLALGSALGGLAYGAQTWRLPGRHRLPLPAIALSLVLAATGLAPQLWELAVAVCCAGVFVSPTLATAYLVADEYASADARTQAGTWVNSAFNAGNAAGNAAAGLLIGSLPLSLCFAAAACPALAAALSALVRVRPRKTTRKTTQPAPLARTPSLSTPATPPPAATSPTTSHTTPPTTSPTANPPQS